MYNIINEKIGTMIDVSYKIWYQFLPRK